MSGNKKRKIIGNPVATTINPSKFGGGGGGGTGQQGADVYISDAMPEARNCIWFNTSKTIPTDSTILTLTDNTEGGIVAEVNGVDYGVGNIKEDDDATTKEYDYTLI